MVDVCMMEILVTVPSSLWASHSPAGFRPKSTPMVGNGRKSVMPGRPVVFNSQFLVFGGGFQTSVGVGTKPVTNVTTPSTNDSTSEVNEGGTMPRDALNHGTGCNPPMPPPGVGAVGLESLAEESGPACDVADPGTGRGNGRGAGVGRGRGRSDSGSGKGASGTASGDASADAPDGAELEEERPTSAYTVMGADGGADSGEDSAAGEETTTSGVDVLLSNWSLLRSMGPTRGSVRAA